jgi:hypothetical protein
VTAFCPALFQVFSKGIQPGLSLPWCTFREIRCPEEASNRGAGDVKFTGDRSLCETALVCHSDRVKQCLSLLSPLLALLFVFDRRFRRDFFDRRCTRVNRLNRITWSRKRGGRFRQLNPLQNTGQPLQHALERLCQITEEMESICHLERIRRTLPRTLGVSTGSIAADDLHRGMRPQPLGQRLGFAVWQEINGLAPLIQLEIGGGSLDWRKPIRGKELIRLGFASVRWSEPS